MRHLVTAPNPILSSPSWELPPVNKWEDFAKELIEAMHHHKGLGLSAVQLGLPYRVFAMRGIGGNLCLFMPQILKQSKETDTQEEGCLSIPGVLVKIERPSEVKIRALSANGEQHTYIFNYMQARVAQHEYDHLLGKLITDYKPSNLLVP